MKDLPPEYFGVEQDTVLVACPTYSGLATCLDEYLEAYKDFHWPGSPVGADYDEQPFMALMRERAFEIRGLPAPPLAPPAPPRLLQVSSAGLITWQGSVGANDYVIERAGSVSGPWTAAGEADESFVQYHPLFADESAMPIIK